MKKYRLTSTGVQDMETKVFIPASLLNRDWRKYQEWLKKKGNKPDPEFTADELVAQKQRKIRKLENAIVDTRLRKDAANAESLSELESDCQIELNKLRAELIAEQGV